MAKDKNTQILVIYPGRFSPFTKGHKAVYEYLTDKYDNVYVATSDKVDPPRSPFSFEEKKMMMELTGMDTTNVVLTKSPYVAMEITQNFDRENTILLFAVSKKDMAEDPRFTFKPKKDGSPSYFQAMPEDGQMETMNKHAYIITVPTFKFDVLGKPMTSATEVRSSFANTDDDTKKKLIHDLFGNYSEDVFNLMSRKITEDAGQFVQHGNHPHRIFGGLDGEIRDATETLEDLFIKVKDSPVGTKVRMRFMIKFHGALNALKRQMSINLELREGITLNFATKELSKLELKEYYINSYKNARNVTFQQHLVNDILTFSKDNRLLESAEFESIAPWLENIKSLETAKRIKVGDFISVIDLDLSFGWKEARVDGFLEPKELVEINQTNKQINYVKFEDGSTYPKDLKIKATYKNRPLRISYFFKTRDDSNKTLSYMTLSIPNDWELINELVNVEEEMRENYGLDKVNLPDIITLKRKKSTVNLALSESNNKVQIRVLETGKILPLRNLNKIYKRGYRKITEKDIVELSLKISKDNKLSKEYIGYEIYVRRFNDYFIASVYIKGSDNEITKAKGQTRKESVSNAVEKIDTLIATQSKVSKSATIDFNAAFTNLLLKSEDEIWAKIVPGPKLVIAGDLTLEYTDPKSEGFFRSSERLPYRSEFATNLLGIPLSAVAAKNANVTANSRYVIADETKDENENRVFDLVYHSTVQNKTDRKSLPGPGLTIGTARIKENRKMESQKLGVFAKGRNKVSIWETDGTIVLLDQGSQRLQETKGSVNEAVNALYDRGYICESVDMTTLKNAAGAIMNVFFDTIKNTTTVRDQEGGSRTYQVVGDKVIAALQKKGFKASQGDTGGLSLEPRAGQQEPGQMGMHGKMLNASAYGQKYGVWAQVSGGATGHRESWAKKDGKRIEVGTYEEAQALARKYTQGVSMHATARYVYSPREIFNPMLNAEKMSDDAENELLAAYQRPVAQKRIRARKLKY